MPKIVILTGAGVSAESGIRTFRDNGGLWENHRLEDVATPEAFAANPELVYRFYNERRQQLQHGDIQPNAAHIAIAELEQRIGDDLLLVTQNVDNLHERGGSRRVVHMHGELMRGRCCRTGQSFALGGNNSADIDASSRCNCCSPGSAVRPDIVWFGEMPFHMEEIYQALWQADLFVAIGTSGQVYPAAGFVQEAGSAKTVELNLEPSAQESFFDEQIYGAASEIVPEFFRQFGG